MNGENNGKDRANYVTVYSDIFTYNNRSGKILIQTHP